MDPRACLVGLLATRLICCCAAPGAAALDGRLAFAAHGLPAGLVAARTRSRGRPRGPHDRLREDL